MVTQHVLLHSDCNSIIMVQQGLNGRCLLGIHGHPNDTTTRVHYPGRTKINTIAARTEYFVHEGLN